MCSRSKASSTSSRPAAGADPPAYRLRLLRDARGREVLQRVGAMMQWTPRGAAAERSGKILNGRGIAYVAENYVAMGMGGRGQHVDGRCAWPALI
jgi:hypothetical protein